MKCRCSRQSNINASIVTRSAVQGERGQGDRESLLSGHDDCVKKNKKKTYNIGMNIKICILKNMNIVILDKQ